MDRLRIMHVVDSFGTGGTEGGIRKLLSGLDPTVFEQIVCTVRPSTQQDAGTEGRIISLGRSKDERQLLIGKLKQVIERERPHVVHSRNWGAIEAVVASRLFGVGGAIHSEHGLELSSYRTQPLRRKMIRRLSFQLADRVFAVSETLRTYYSRQLLIRKDRIGVIANGVDTERFRPQDDLRRAERQRLRVKDNILVVGTVGRLDPIKDHPTLFAAVDELLAAGHPIQLVVVGDGPERKRLEADVRSRNFLAAHTLFVGESSDIVSHLNAFDVFVLPSLAEGMPNSLLEAMSVGLACVATRVGGNPELIEDRATGLLFEAGNVTTLATQLKDLALNREVRQDFGTYARRRVEEHYSLHVMLRNYAHLYQGVLNRRRTALNGFHSTRRKKIGAVEAIVNLTRKAE